MDAQTIKKMALMDEVTKGYLAHMPDDQVQAFMAKAPAAQAEEAAAAKKAADAKKALELTPAPAGDSDVVKSLQAQIEVLTKANTEAALERTLEKAAADPAYAGFPGGAPAVVTQLKSIQSLPEEDRAPIINLMKAQAATARNQRTTLGFDGAGDFVKTAPATHQLMVKSAAAATAAGTLERVERAKALRDPANAAMAQQVYQEQGIL